MLGDTPWPLMGAPPGKLQPLSKGQTSRTHQIFADVEKILGRPSIQCKTELGDLQGLESAQKATEKIYLGFSDPEIEKMELRTRQQRLGAGGAQNLEALHSGQDVSECRSQTPAHSKLSEAPKGLQLKGEQRNHSIATLNCTGPGGDKGQSPIPLPPSEEEPSLSLCSSDHTLPARKNKLFLLEGSPVEDFSWQGVPGEGGDLGRERWRREPPGLWMGQVSKLINKDTPERCKETEPAVHPKDAEASAEDSPQGPSLMPADTPASEAVPKPPLGDPASEDRPHPPESPEPLNEDRKPSVPGADSDESSGGGSSLASPLGSQVLGEVNNFPWGLQNPQGSVPMMGQSGPGPRDVRFCPFLMPQLSHMSSVEEQSESEDYSEDQRFYQHILQMVKISRRLEGLGLSENMQDIPCKDVCSMANESSRMSSEGEQKVIRAPERDSGLLGWGPELLEHPPGAVSAPAGQEASQQAQCQPGNGLRQGLVQPSSDIGLAAEPSKMQLLNQVGFLAGPKTCPPPHSSVGREQVKPSGRFPDAYPLTTQTATRPDDLDFKFVLFCCLQGRAEGIR